MSEREETADKIIEEANRQAESLGKFTQQMRTIREASKQPGNLRCGDRIYLNGVLLGIAHRWVKEGVSVDLVPSSRRVAVVRWNDLHTVQFETDAVIVPFTRLESGEFTYKVSDPKADPDCPVTTTTAGPRGSVPVSDPKI